MKKHTEILIALPLAYQDGADKYSGIARYLAKTRRDWTLHIVRNSLSPATVRAALADGIAGIIADTNAAGTAREALAAADVPVVIFEATDPRPFARRRKTLTIVNTDSEEIGRRAAEYLCEQGTYRSYAYIPAKEDERWSYARGTAFTNCAASHGIVCHTYSGDIELTAFLKSLEPPTALFAATDIRANEVLQAAKIARLPVPRRLAVIGVDDNRLICENAHPRLSSIRPDFDKEGYLAARELDRMMDHASRRAAPLHTPAIIRVGIKGIALRDSTAEETTAGKLVSRASSYIRDNATKGITVDDVIRHMKVSRRLLYLRFSEQRGETILEAIRKRQMEEVLKLLQTTRLPTEKIASLCGFANANVLRNLFKRTFSVSMRDYRRTEQGKSAV